MCDITWRFNGNNYNPDNGLDTPNTETFKKDPIASLARESCQNSIDAGLEGEKVRIEFQSFTIDKEQIPERDKLVKEIESCINYKKKKPNSKEKEQLVKMLSAINKDKIHCLRVSDFNTTGLLGVASRDDTPFYLLTKGSGITNKGSGSGGSKGIGKYASFVVSLFNSVFYSTYTVKDEKGHIGICMLCSSEMEGTDERTHGVGYYGTNSKQDPILEQINLDPNFERTTYGTDIYILGFRDDSAWEKEIIVKVLDSFLCAIEFGELEVKVNDVEINASTLKDIVFDDTLITTKTAKSSIRSQYILLKDPSVLKEELMIEDFGTVTIYLKGFSREEQHLATNNCIMIRQPLMKIKEFKSVAATPCSAMCIIPNGALNDILRNVENPQHTDWYFKGIDDVAEREEVTAIYNGLRNTIYSFIAEKLAISENDETDIEGAGDYLPAVDEGDVTGGEEETPSEQPKVVKKTRNKVKDKIGVFEDSEGQALVPDVGGHEEGEGSPTPEGENQGTGGTPHDTDEEGKPTEGDNDIMVIEQLIGMQYVPFIIDDVGRKYVISFISLYDEEKCDLEFYHLDDSGNKYKTEITNCKINGEVATVEDGNVVGFPLKNKEKYKFEVDTDLDDKYTCEVKIYAHR